MSARANVSAITKTGILRAGVDAFWVAIIGFKGGLRKERVMLSGLQQ